MAMENFLSLEEEAYLAIVRTAAQLAHEHTEALRRVGLTAVQYNVLRILRGAPDGLSRTELSELMVSQQPDASRMLDRLEASGLISRDQDREDRRRILTHITAAGLALLERADDISATLHARQFGHLPAEALEQLTDLLERAVL